MQGTFTLPNGRLGQALAVAFTLLAAILLWITTAGPLLGWYQTRAAQLAQQQVIAAHMAVLDKEIPALRKAVSAAGLQAQGDQVLFPGATDAIAGANLQTALQNLATQAGTSLDSAELLPAQPEDGLRRIGMQVSVTTGLPVLTALLQAIGEARPRMIVGELSVSNPTQGPADQGQPMQVNFTVTGFRAGAP
jgi:general secretion pathway protein M